MDLFPVSRPSETEEDETPIVLDYFVGLFGCTRRSTRPSPSSAGVRPQEVTLIINEHPHALWSPQEAFGSSKDDLCDSQGDLKGRCHFVCSVQGG